MIDFRSLDGGRRLIARAAGRPPVGGLALWIADRIAELRDAAPDGWGLVRIGARRERDRPGHGGGRWSLYGIFERRESHTSGSQSRGTEPQEE